jgi:predicted transglutaminase-like cysteine proteinase
LIFHSVNFNTSYLSINLRSYNPKQGVSKQLLRILAWIYVEIACSIISRISIIKDRIKKPPLGRLFVDWSDIIALFSDRTIDTLEAKLVEGQLDESQALKLLQHYNASNRRKDAQKALDRILANNLRTKQIISYAIHHYLQKRDYQNAYRYSKDLCYSYDRYGQALLQLSKLAVVISKYSLATNWLQEYMTYNNSNVDLARYWLGNCFLRKRHFQKALSCLENGTSLFANPDLLYWLAAIVDGKYKFRNNNWFGHKTTPMKKHGKLKWKDLVLNCPLDFQAKSINQIDEWISNGKYISDERLYGESDKWQIPSEFEKIKAGDCEDFALWTWVQLLRMNINARFMLGGLYSEDLNHAWVCIYGSGGVKIFECTPSEFNAPIDIRNAPEYMPVLSIDRSLIWYSHN